jgi:hypothetical protein
MRGSVQPEPTETNLPEVDFLLRDHGSIILLRPVTEGAREWVDAHIGEDNGYQPMWPTVTIERRLRAPDSRRHSGARAPTGTAVSGQTKKIKPSDLRRQAQAMIRDGSMPSLETLLQAVAEAREKYAVKIKISRLGL